MYRSLLGSTLYNSMVNADTLVGCALLLPMLRELNHFIKCCQFRGLSVSQLAKTLATTQCRLNEIYINSETRFDKAGAAGRELDFPELAALRQLDGNGVLHLNSDQHLVLKSGDSEHCNLTCLCKHLCFHIGGCTQHPKVLKGAGDPIKRQQP
jgi:hypothetical protein